MKKKPDPEEFAKAVLWNIASIRAELASLREEFRDFQDVLGKTVPAKRIEELFDQEGDRKKMLYQDVCRQAGLPLTPPGTNDEI